MFRRSAILPTLCLATVTALLFTQGALAVSLYAQDSVGNQLYLVDTANLGSPQLIGTFSGYGTLGDVAMLATASATALYMIDRADNRLLTVDRTTAAIVAAVTIDVDIATAPRGIDLSPDGLLYVVVSNTPLLPTLRTVDPVTGVTTTIGPMNALGIEALAFAPDGTLYAAGASGGGDSNTLYRVDRLTGALTTIATMTLPGLDIDDLVFGPDGFLYGADSYFGPADLYRIDPASGALTNLGSTGVYGLNGLAVSLPAVPIPPAVLLFGSALGLMGVMRRKLSA